jgi:hypothetical protein
MKEYIFLAELAVRRGLPPAQAVRLLSSIGGFLRRNPDFLLAPKIMSEYRDEAPRSALLIFTGGGKVGAAVLLTAGSNRGYTASMLPVSDCEYTESVEFSEWIESLPEELFRTCGRPDIAARIDARVLDLIRTELSRDGAGDALYILCRAMLLALRLGLLDIDPAPLFIDVFSEIRAEDILYRFRERFGFPSLSFRDYRNVL